ncbi:MAG: phosphatase domain-containing protein [Paracoccaceae bacterium]
MATDITTSAGRLRALWHFHMVDHGILRVFWTNLAEIAPGVWRSNQPSPGRLRKYQEMGMRAVLNLRNENTNSPYVFEKAACDSLGLILVNQNLSAGRLVDRDSLLSMLDKFEMINRPFIMHCKSGADRAGLASALYLLHIQGKPVSEAKKQLSFKFLHFRSFQAGVLDHMLDAYETDIRQNPMSIREWIETRYDNRKLMAEFDAKRGRS